MSSDLAEHIYTIPDHVPTYTCIPIFGYSQESILFTLEKSIMFMSIVGAGVTLGGPDAYLAEHLFNHVHATSADDLINEIIRESNEEITYTVTDDLINKIISKNDEEITYTAEEAARLDVDDYSMRNIRALLPINGRRGH